MTYISNSAECPKCGGGHKARPFTTYANGVHCFSCGYTEIYDRSFTTQESRIPEIPGLTNLKARMSEFTLINQQWLNKYYVTSEDVTKHCIKEAPDGALIFYNSKGSNYQKRYNTTPRRILGYGPKTPSLIAIGSPTIVLVEDYVSHIRVGKYYDTACLWGIKASREFLSTLLNYKTIAVWLDNDSSKEVNSGQEAAKIICKNLHSILQYKKRRYSFGGVELPNIVNIATEQDPKYYSPVELNKILEGKIYANQQNDCSCSR